MKFSKFFIFFLALSFYNVSFADTLASQLNNTQTASYGTSVEAGPVFKFTGLANGVAEQFRFSVSTPSNTDVMVGWSLYNSTTTTTICSGIGGGSGNWYTLTGSPSMTTYTYDLTGVGTSGTCTIVLGDLYTLSTDIRNSSASTNVALSMLGSSTTYDFSSNPSTPYFELADSGGFSPPVPDYSGIFNILPSNNSTTETISVDVSAEYLFLSTDFPIPVQYLKVWLNRTDIPEIQQSFQWQDIVMDSLEEISTEFTLTEGGIYEMYWSVSGEEDGLGFFFNHYENYLNTFSVVTSIEDVISLYKDCSVTEVAGCIQNALLFLFYPSSNSLSQFTGLYSTIENKPPFGYVTAINSILKNLNDTETAIFELQSMTLLNTYIFIPFREAINWLMWLGFAFILFHRFKNIHL